MLWPGSVSPSLADGSLLGCLSENDESGNQGDLMASRCWD